MPGGGVPDVPVVVTLSLQSIDYPVTTDPVTGHYSLDAPPGTYYLSFEYMGNENIVKKIYENGAFEPGVPHSPSVVLTEGSPRVIDKELISRASISGTVVGTGNVILDSLTATIRGWGVGRSIVDLATGHIKLIN